MADFFDVERYSIKIAHWDVYCERCHVQGKLGDMFGENEECDIHCVKCIAERVNDGYAVIANKEKECQ